VQRCKNDTNRVFYENKEHFIEDQLKPKPGNDFAAAIYLLTRLTLTRHRMMVFSSRCFQICCQGGRFPRF